MKKKTVKACFKWETRQNPSWLFSILFLWLLETVKYLLELKLDNAVAIRSILHRSCNHSFTGFSLIKLDNSNGYTFTFLQEFTLIDQKIQFGICLSLKLGRKVKNVY